jgi:hypothetical protein
MRNHCHATNGEHPVLRLLARFGSKRQKKSSQNTGVKAREAHLSALGDDLKI